MKSGISQVNSYIVSCALWTKAGTAHSALTAVSNVVLETEIFFVDV